jgi:NAD(P)-dependent dehydrogenase (short-subunit alcohol dehydrogenase family)
MRLRGKVCVMARGLAEELANHEVAVLALSPGWMRVERMTGPSERERAQTESLEYLGCAVAALATDPADTLAHRGLRAAGTGEPSVSFSSTLNSQLIAGRSSVQGFSSQAETLEGARGCYQGLGGSRT